MDSTLSLAISLPITAIVLLGLVWLLLKFLSSERAASRQMSLEKMRLEANLQVTQSKVQLETMTTLSEDQRSQSLAVLTAIRETTSTQQNQQAQMAETFRLQAATLLQAQQEGTTRLEQHLTRQQESQTSLLKTLVSMVGTKDSLAFAQVHAAAQSTSPDQAGAPYTTGDEEVERAMQEILDNFRGAADLGANGGEFFESGLDLRDLGIGAG